MIRTVFHDVVAIGERRCKVEVLFHQQDGKALRFKAADRVADLLDDDRSEPFGGLVEQKKPRSSAQNSGNCQHLLLATGEFCSLTRQAFAQIGKQRENSLEIEAAGAHYRRQQQILLHVEAGKNSALLRTKSNARFGNHVRGTPDQFRAFVAHRTGAALDDAHDRLERRRFTDAVAAEQSHDFAGANLEIGAMQDMGLAVPGLQVLYRKERGRLRHGRSPDRPRARRDRPTRSGSRPPPEPGRG